jgi:hypothetical protein
MRASDLSSTLGSDLGLVCDIDFFPFHFDNDEDFVNQWGSRCGVVVCTSATQSNSCGFFESMLRGVFGSSEATADEILALRKAFMSSFLEMWADDRCCKFRTCVWEHAEFQRYVQGRTKFNLEELVNEWLGDTVHAVPVQRLMMEVFATAFKVQIGIMALNQSLQPVLSIYGPLRCARIYIAWNGHNDHRQRFYYFERSG